jgi:hypothetical protein
MPAPVPPNPPPKRPPVPRMATRLESVDEIRAAIQARQAEIGVSAPHPPTVATLPQAPTPVPNVPLANIAGSPARLFKPSIRPPVALLHVFDDGADEGEIIRLRDDRFVIGRSEGDLVLPHDGQVSSRHAELVRQQEEDKSWVWVLFDLGSTNGTFVRAGAAVLKDGQEFLVGRTRYRLDAAAGEPQASSELPKGTIAWNSSANLPVPSVVELMLAGPGARVPLLQAEYWIGSDQASCAIVPGGDPFVSPRHARLSRDAKGRWHINNNKAINGVWVRIEQMELASSCQFQVGEQRFSFKVH